MMSRLMEELVKVIDLAGVGRRDRHQWQAFRQRYPEEAPIVNQHSASSL